MSIFLTTVLMWEQRGRLCKPPKKNVLRPSHMGQSPQKYLKWSKKKRKIDKHLVEPDLRQIQNLKKRLSQATKKD